MSTENKGLQTIMVVVSVLLLAVTVVYLLNSLFNVVGQASNDEGVTEHVTAAADQRIRPVAEVATGDVSAAPVARSAKDIVSATCMGCHGSGAMGAPKIGEKAQWSARVNAGMDVLMKNAINGKGMMPARGGNPSLSDDDMKKAIDYMLKESGI